MEYPELSYRMDGKRFSFVLPKALGIDLGYRIAKMLDVNAAILFLDFLLSTDEEPWKYLKEIGVTADDSQKPEIEKGLYLGIARFLLEKLYKR